MPVAARSRGSAAASLLGLRVRIAPRPWIFVSYKCCVLSEVSATGRSLIQRRPTVYRVSECQSVFVKPQWWGGFGPLGLWNYERKNEIIKLFLGLLSSFPFRVSHYYFVCISYKYHAKVNVESSCSDSPILVPHRRFVPSSEGCIEGLFLVSVFIPNILVHLSVG